MKVVLVNTNHFRGGGDSTYTLNLAELLVSRGHEVAFFAMQDERNLPDQNSDLFVSHVDFKLLNQGKRLASGLQTLGRVIYSTEARRRFGQLLDRFEPDIVHLQNIHSHISPSVIFEAKARHLPVVWTLHDYRQICPNSNLLNDRTAAVCECCGRGAYYQALLQRCKKGSVLASGLAALEAYCHRLMRVRKRVDAFLTPSTFLRNKLVDRGFPSAQVIHLPLFLPDAMFKGLGGTQDYFLFLGNLLPGKGIHILLEACRCLPEISLKLAGRVAEPLARELPGLLPPNVQFQGMVQGQELNDLRRGALAVVLPSLWYENQPFAILEAFAAGKPVVASNLGGMSELVNGERGLLVSPGDALSLSEGMRWLAAHRMQAQEMGQAGFTYAMREHGSATHYDRLMRAYRDAARVQPHKPTSG